MNKIDKNYYSVVIARDSKIDERGKIYERKK
jgi:hypothetical protein